MPLPPTVTARAISPACGHTVGEGWASLPSRCPLLKRSTPRLLARVLMALHIVGFLVVEFIHQEGTAAFAAQCEPWEALTRVVVWSEQSAEWGPEDMSYGMREFAIKDPDGYLLSFGQPLPPADGEGKALPS